MKSKALIAYICIFIALVVFVIVANMVKLPLYKYAMVLPVSFLAIVAFIAGRGMDVALPIALAFSALGDFFGAHGIFILQLASFAVAHIAFIAYLLKHAWVRPKLLLCGLVIAVAAVLLGFKIMPNVTVSVERVGVVAYIPIITIMAWSSILWRDRNKGWYIAAALLFMASDTILAWHRYVSPVPYRSELILATYYLAQFIFATCYIYRFVKTKGFNPAYPF